MHLLCHHGRLLLLVLLLLAAAASRGDPTGGTYDSSKCQRQNDTCGRVSVRYPFYLSSAAEVLPEYDGELYCGHPGLAITCDGGTAILQLDDDNYTVSGIDYTSLTVSLADADVVVGSCPIVDHNVTGLPPARLFFPNITAYLFFFINCTFGEPEDDDVPKPLPPKPPTIKPITCGGSDEGPSTFVLPENDVPPKDWWRGCQAVYQVPVLGDALPADAEDPGWRKDGYVKALREGFQVTWGPSSGECSRCEQSDGKCSYNRTGGFFGCLCANGLVDNDGCSKIYHSTAPPSADEHLKKRKIDIIASALSVLLLCLIFFTILLGYKKYRSKKISKETPRIESFLQKNGTLHPKRYTYAQVKRITKSFAEKLGQGGFGVVYRGDLSDGRQIAVKMLKDSEADGEEFINEVASISKTSHVNIVTLLGFCLEGSRRALIYDYMPNGSLERYAFNDNSKGENTLSWEKLFDIAVGIARGLEYLHRGCNTRIVHFDIKPHNILLDQDFCPKISDFGLAKLCLHKDSVISISGARGTIGYIAPEVYSKQFGTISSKSDVYSYGMMVLEMVGARDKNIDANSESSSQYFPQWIYDHLDEYCAGASEINGEVTEIVRKMIVVGLWCIQLSPTNRPTMTRVVEMLEESTSGLELPPKVLLS